MERAVTMDAVRANQKITMSRNLHDKDKNRTSTHHCESDHFDPLTADRITDRLTSIRPLDPQRDTHLAERGA